VTTGRGILAVIVNYRTAELAEKCLTALAGERTAELRIAAIVVDGGSGDGSAEKLAEVTAREEFADWVEFLPLDFNGGFGWANNQAILHRAQSEAGLPEFIYLLNPDAEVMPGAVAPLCRLLDNNPRIGAVGSQLLNPDGSNSASCFRFPSIGREFIRGSSIYFLHHLTRIKPAVVALTRAGPVDWVTGASVMMRRATLVDTGLFDDGFFLYFEEVELMHRMKKRGWSVWHEPLSMVRHLGGASTGVVHSAAPKPLPAYWYQSRQRYFARTQGLLKTMFANIAWLLAHYGIGRPRSAVSSGVSSRKTPGEAAGRLRAGLWPRHADMAASYPHVSDSAGTAPAWASRS
jgi:N-acetylglucosaminyl-diphospho-decaprenol L-rhamnosyltransferase